MSDTKLRNILLFPTLILICLLSGCINANLESCPPVYGFVLKKLPQAPSTDPCHNLTDTEALSISLLGEVLINFIHEAESNVTVDDVGYDSWNSTIVKLNEISNIDDVP